MRTRRVSWRDLARPPQHSGVQVPRWRGQLLGALLIVLALGIIYHSAISQSIARELDLYLGGTAATTATSPPSAVGPPAAQDLSQELSATAQAASSQDWQLASDELRAAEASWASLESTYSHAGVSATDLNAFTADLANLTLSISEHNGAATVETAQNAQKSLAWMTNNFITGAGPTFQEMSALVKDLNTATQQQDWTRVKADAKALQQMMQSIQQGF